MTKKPDLSSFVVLKYMCVCASELMYVHECSCSWRPADGIGSPGAGVTGNYELRINSGPL